jgi:pimeloyl-ACP methyl ester carboxylesterase
MERVEVNGTVLGVDDRGEGPVVVLLHGFPELAYSWRHQVPALVEAGYRVIALDQRGYGSSAVTEAVTHYTLTKLTGDVVGVLDRLDVEVATIVGHDWGSIVAYTSVILHPDRFDRIVSLNVPYRGACWVFPTTEFIRENLAERFSYVLMFQAPGAAERGFARDPRSWLNAFYLGGARGRTFLTDEEFDVYAEAFTRSGITGPVNWYRNIDANAAALAHARNERIDHPCLLIAADADPVIPLELTEGLDRWMPRLDVVVIDDCGHWTQQERPADVNDALIDWLAS